MAKENQESIYSILSNIIKIKFSSLLKDSGIKLESIYRMTNIQSGKEHFLLIVNSKEIKFVTTYDFIFHFSNFLGSNIKYYNARYKELIDQNSNEYTDHVAVEMEYKSIDYCRRKQLELLKLLLETKDKLEKKKKRQCC